jgi:ABC-2 type transport system permease protein
VIHLMRSEWIKFRSVRSTIVVLLIGGAIVVLASVLVAFTTDDTTTSCVALDPATTSTTTVEDPTCGPGWQLVERPTTTNLTDLTFGVSYAALIFGTLGVQVIGQEYRFNTIRPTFTAAPRRGAVMAAKLAVVTGACSAIAVVMVAFCWLVGTVMLDGFVVDGVDRRAALGIVAFTALWTMAGLGVGAIVRQPVAGILIVAFESLVIEALVGGIFPSTLRWMPFANGIQMTLRIEESGGDLQPVLQGGIYFGVVCLALFLVGSWLVNRRDA